MEGYEILSLYKDKFKGALYLGSDNPSNKKRMLGNGLKQKLNYNKFNSACISAISNII